MKVTIDYTNLYLKNNVKPIVKWKKSGPILYTTHKLHYDIDKLIMADEDGLLEFLFDLEYEIECKTHLIQLYDLIEYIKGN